MNEFRTDDRFSRALRAELVTRVQETAPARTRKRARLWLSAAALAGAGLLGGVGATAAGVFVTPGSLHVTPLSSPVTATHSGTATVQLGAPPEGATGVQMDIVCLTPGRFEYDGGASSSCAAADVGSLGERSGLTVPLSPGQESVTITTEPDARWRLTAQYVRQETTGWVRNGNGDSYGAQNENGAPDLISVMATNGIRGYAYRTDLEEADGTAAMRTFKSPQDAVDWQKARRGKSFPVPVYDVDGKSVVGEFVVEADKGGPGLNNDNVLSGELPAGLGSSTACALPKGEQGVPLTAPEAQWSLNRKVAVPAAPTTFGPGTNRDGVAKCFAHNPSGALFAGAHMLSVAWQEGPHALVTKYAVDSPEKVWVLESLPTRTESLPDPVPQIKGYRITMDGPDKAIVQMAISRKGSLVSGQVNLEWAGSDWTIDASSVLSSLGAPINDLTGYTPWAGA